MKTTARQRGAVGLVSDPQPKIESAFGGTGGQDGTKFVLCLSTNSLMGPDGKAIPLTRLETRLLVYLAGQGGREISKTELLTEVWQYHPRAATHTVETHIWRLRRKLQPSFQNIEIIQTVENGYTVCRGFKISHAED